MEYIYSQRDPRWANLKLGRTNLTMSDFGCVVTSCAMILSYYLDRQVLPSELLKWLNEHNGFTAEGLLYWGKITEFSGGKLRYATSVAPQEGELTYGIRQVFFGRYNHWIIDHPRTANHVIDPFYGKIAKYDEWRYTNNNRYFFGKPLAPQRYPVDDRYGRARTWATFLDEKRYRFYWIPGSPAAYIYSKVKRPITDRELCGFVYGGWHVGAIFYGEVGTDWLHETKAQWLKKRGL